MGSTLKGRSNQVLLTALVGGLQGLLWSNRAYVAGFVLLAPAVGILSSWDWESMMGAMRCLYKSPSSKMEQQMGLSGRAVNCSLARLQ